VSPFLCSALASARADDFVDLLQNFIGNEDQIQHQAQQRFYEWRWMALVVEQLESDFNAGKPPSPIKPLRECIAEWDSWQRSDGNSKTPCAPDKPVP
jgi:hypothetical protein